MVEFHRFSLQGKLLAKKALPLREHEGGVFNREKSRLFTLISQTLGEPAGSSGDSILAVCPLRAMPPESVLTEENYRPLRKLLQNIGEQLSTPEAAAV
jgi:hypothetical protein